MPNAPLQGEQEVPPLFDDFGGSAIYQHPTLIPNFYPEMATLPADGQSSMQTLSPEQYAQKYPRSNATATITVGGTITAGNTLTVGLANPVLVYGAASVAYTVQSADTVETIASALAGLLNAVAHLDAYDVRASAAGAVITVSWPGPVGNFATLSVSTSSGATETLTMSPSGGDLTGGDGYVVPRANFTYALDENTRSYMAGMPYDLPYTVLSAMVQDGMPVS